ncbi:sugar transferase [Methylophilus methylotrophus]|uniref:sugar transferase n=1 Tax=Methylophilus methylotrophus TaxID=17 RepID=UPI0003604972|nr:sugar transferase [Methylophilus methylotrophus]
MIKRLMDILLVVMALSLLWPLMLVIALLVRWRLGKPVIFSQTRPGYLGKPFRIYKFRSMTDALDANGSPLPDAMRLTKFGNFLRSTSLDELPNLWAILKGDMSLVGPRPLLTEYLPLYNAQQARRHLVKPGLTGWAQINGRNAISWQDKFMLDSWYVDHQSLWLDIKIILLTIKKIFVREGISAKGEATMPKFTGND